MRLSGRDHLALTACTQRQIQVGAKQVVELSDEGDDADGAGLLGQTGDRPAWEGGIDTANLFSAPPLSKISASTPEPVDSKTGARRRKKNKVKVGGGVPLGSGEVLGNGEGDHEDEDEEEEERRKEALPEEVKELLHMAKYVSSQPMYGKAPAWARARQAQLEGVLPSEDAGQRWGGAGRTVAELNEAAVKVSEGAMKPSQSVMDAGGVGKTAEQVMIPRCVIVGLSVLILLPAPATDLHACSY